MRTNARTPLTGHRVAAQKVAKDVDALKLALWYISKCESLDTAERAFNAAVAATRSLEKKE